MFLPHYVYRSHNRECKSSWGLWRGTPLEGNAIGFLSHSSVLDLCPLTHIYRQSDCYLLLSVWPHKSHKSLWGRKRSGQGLPKASECWSKMKMTRFLQIWFRVNYMEVQAFSSFNRESSYSLNFNPRMHWLPSIYCELSQAKPFDLATSPKDLKFGQCCYLIIAVFTWRSKLDRRTCDM